MPIGDAATAAGLPLVPETGSDAARVRWGAQEINRTRDMIATAMASVPNNKAEAREQVGISTGTSLPTTGVEGDIFFLIQNTP